MNRSNFPLAHQDAFLKAILDENLEAASSHLSTSDAINRRYDPNGWTALHFAVEHMVLRSVRWLLDNRANPNEKDIFGQTPLHLAIDVEADSVAQEYPKTGSTAISAELTKVLLEHGADPNVQTQNGKTPLSWAISMNHTEAVRLLKLHGAIK